MDSPSNYIWAELVALNPDKKDIHFFSQLEELAESSQSDTGWRIYQRSTGESLITNHSGNPIKIGDTLLETGEEKEIFSGERISFNKDKESKDQSFDYVFCLVGLKSKNKNKRKREKSLEPQMIPSNQEAIKLTKVISGLEQELTCSICKNILHRCATLNPCLHTFCSSCLLYHFKTSSNCPLCRVEAASVTKNLALQNIVELTLKNFPEKERSREEIERNNTELEGTIVKKKSWTYVGAYQNGKREGKGNMIYSKGNIYEGTWKNDKKEGEGTLIFPNGKICKGRWLDDEMQKIAEMRTKKGVYEGETEKFEMHGKGVFKWNNGDIYDGNFVRNVQEGFGILKCQDGVFYEGEWKNNKKEGTGVGIFKNGDQYEGSWVKDYCHGKGEYTSNDGGKYEGDWVKGLQSGNGTMKFPDGRIYEGQWKNGDKKGSGVLILSNGDKYEGVWAKNVLQSVRKVSYTNGDTYEGGIQIESLKRHGEGVMTFKNGDRYEGNWLNDKQHGKGREICRDGKRVFEGVWEEGNMVGEIIMTDANGKRFKAEWKELDE